MLLDGYEKQGRIVSEWVSLCQTLYARCAALMATYMCTTGFKNGVMDTKVLLMSDCSNAMNYIHQPTKCLYPLG